MYPALGSIGFSADDSQAIPERYSKHGLHKLDEYFAMGRGHQKEGVDVPSLVGCTTLSVIMGNG